MLPISTPVPSPISIHTSPKGGDLTELGCHVTRLEFQSTPPRREVTILPLYRCNIRIDFNPHLPEGR